MTPKSYAQLRRPRLLTVTEGGRSATIMIGPVRGPEHLALIHNLRFYHVPVSAIAAARTAVEFLAFYEPASRFRAATGVIHEYAAILRVSRVLRHDLPGLTWPGRRGESTPYYRFDLGPILSLPHRITNPDRLRIVFRFPELERLQTSTTMRDLGKGRLPPPSAGERGDAT